MTLTYDSADLTCLGEYTLMYLRGAGGWTQTQMGEGHSAVYVQLLRQGISP